MCIHDYIYENYDDYKTLEEEYQSVLYFYTALEQRVDNYPLSWLVSDSQLLTKIKTLIKTFAYPIYYEYYNDKLAYKDKDTFLMRLINSVARKVNRWYMQHKIDEDLLNNATLENFISNGGTHSETNENASTGSAVIQKSASTPTGIEHNAQSESMDMELSHTAQSDNTSLEVTDDYQDKYTNFVGKTNGLHRNEVDRDTDITRTSNYGLSQEILSKIPYSYISELLREVSQHFIQIY